MPGISKRAEHDELLERSRPDCPPIEVSLLPNVSISVLIVSSQEDSTGKVEVWTQVLVIEDPSTHGLSRRPASPNKKRPEREERKARTNDTM